MNRTRKCDIYNKDEKGSFVLIHNNEYKEKKREKVAEKASSIQIKGIVEYTDDVAEQMRMIYTKIPVNLKEYYKGMSDLDDINNRLRQYYYLIKNYCINTGLTKENNEAYKYKLLQDIYRSYRHNAVIIAMDMNEEEGKMLQKEYLNTSVHTCFYYNSDYFYWCKKIREALLEIVRELAKEEDIKNFDTESIDRRKRYIYDFEFNYSWFYKNKVNVSLKEEELIPPKDIKIFYQKMLDEPSEGKLLVFYKSKMTEYTIGKADSEQGKVDTLSIAMESNFSYKNESHLKNFFQSFLTSVIS